MEPTKVYLRIKREVKVFFVVCQLNDPVEVIKKQITPYFKQETQDMRLFLGDRLLDEKANLNDQAVPNDSVLLLKLRKPTSEWEE